MEDAKKGGSPSGAHLWLLLWKTAKVLEIHARRSIDALGLCLSDFGVLEILLHKGPLPVNTVGKKILLTSGSVTVAIDRLEERGLVERRADATDRRSRIVHLTEAGSQLAKKIFAEHKQHMERAVSVLNQAETEALARTLRKLGRGAEELL